MELRALHWEWLRALLHARVAQPSLRQRLGLNDVELILRRLSLHNLALDQVLISRNLIYLQLHDRNGWLGFGWRLLVVGGRGHEGTSGALLFLNQRFDLHYYLN